MECVACMNASGTSTSVKLLNKTRSETMSTRFNTLCSLLLVLMSSATSLSAQEQITLQDGSRLAVFMVMPEETSQPAPLVILMGGGPGNLSISLDTSRWLGSGFAERGWAVAVPVSPTNQSFRSAENAEKIEFLISELQQRESIGSGKVLLAGVSNGGMSALGIAARKPENYLGVAAVPALARDSSSLQALNGMPIYLRIGGADQLGWADEFESTAEVLRDVGVELDAAILEGAPHMFRMNWDSLGPWLLGLLD